jgi:GxxExxY protein
MRGELLEAERVHSIVGGFFAVYNYYGYGLSERVYAGALEHELRDRGHEVIRELVVDVRYKGRHVAGQRFDMVVDDRVVVENKARKNYPGPTECS